MRRLLNLLRANAGKGELRAEANTVYVYGPIMNDDMDAEFFGGISATQFANALSAISGDVTIRINSPGGDVFAGVAIAQHIREFKGNVSVVVDGYAASAASIVAVAAPKVTMAPGSFMMIHKAWAIAVGNEDDFLSMAALLEKIDGTIAESYAARGNKSASEFLALMRDETWFTPEDAVNVGLADSIAQDAKKSSAKAWDFSAFIHPPAVSAEEPDKIPPKDESRSDANTLVEQAKMRARAHAARMLARTA